MKKSFILYNDMEEVVKDLSDEQAGQLLKLILEYVNTGEFKTDDTLLKVAFTPIKLQLDRDSNKYQRIVERNQENGKKGGRPPKPKEPNGLNGLKDKPKKADTDTVNETDTKEGLKGESGDSPHSSSPLKPLPTPAVKTFEDNYMAFIAHFNDLKGWETGTKGRFEGDEKSKRQFKVLHKQHKSTDIVKAIKAMFRDQYHIDTGFKYATPEFITRQDKFARFLEQS